MATGIANRFVLLTIPVPHNVGYDTSTMKANSNIDTASFGTLKINQRFIRYPNGFQGELCNAFAMIETLILDQVGSSHEGITDCFNLVQVILGRKTVQLGITAIEQVGDQLWYKSKSKNCL